MKRHIVNFAALVLVLNSGVGATEELALEALPLHHRPANEIAPLIAPLIPPPGGVRAADSQLLIHAAPATLAEIKRLLETLDRPPRRLLITVRQGTSVEELMQGGHLTGEIGTGEARVYRTEERDGAASTQRIQVLEGRQAFIKMGATVPLHEITVERDGHASRVRQRTHYQEVTTGFYVIPRVTGDQVTLDIAPHGARGPDASGAIALEQAQTTVTGRLGEWILIGSSTGQAWENTSAIVHTTERHEYAEWHVMVKVTESP